MHDTYWLIQLYCARNLLLFELILIRLLFKAYAAYNMDIHEEDGGTNTPCAN